MRQIARLGRLFRLARLARLSVFLSSSLDMMKLNPAMLRIAKLIVSTLIMVLDGPS